MRNQSVRWFRFSPSCQNHFNQKSLKSGVWASGCILSPPNPLRFHLVIRTDRLKRPRQGAVLNEQSLKGKTVFELMFEIQWLNGRLEPSELARSRKSSSSAPFCLNDCPGSQIEECAESTDWCNHWIPPPLRCSLPTTVATRFAPGQRILPEIPLDFRSKVTRQHRCLLRELW